MTTKKKPLTDAQRQARRRQRKASQEWRRIEALRAIANDSRLPATTRAIARNALEGKPPPDPPRRSAQEITAEIVQDILKGKRL